MNILLIIVLIPLVILTIYFAYQIALKLYRSIFLHYETTCETAKVVSKDYDEEPYAQIYPKPHQPRFFEEHKIYVICNGQKYCFDNESVYRKVQAGDVIRMHTHKGYNKQGVLKHQYLSIDR